MRVDELRDKVIGHGVEANKTSTINTILLLHLMRRPQSISAKDAMPVGADEYATALMMASCDVVP
jgi:hypothetical protein